MEIISILPVSVIGILIRCPLFAHRFDSNQIVFIISTTLLYLIACEANLINCVASLRFPRPKNRAITKLINPVFLFVRCARRSCSVIGIRNPIFINAPRFSAKAATNVPHSDCKAPAFVPRLMVHSFSLTCVPSCSALPLCVSLSYPLRSARLVGLARQLHPRKTAHNSRAFPCSDYSLRSARLSIHSPMQIRRMYRQCQRSFSRSKSTRSPLNRLIGSTTNLTSSIFASRETFRPPNCCGKVRQNTRGHSRILAIGRARKSKNVLSFLLAVINRLNLSELIKRASFSVCNSIFTLNHNILINPSIFLTFVQLPITHLVESLKKLKANLPIRRLIESFLFISGSLVQSVFFYSCCLPARFILFGGLRRPPGTLPNRLLLITKGCKYVLP